MRKLNNPDTNERADQSTTEHRAEPQPQRLAMIAEAAYFRAERRGFCGGADEATRDWLEAEAEIDALLAQARPSQKPSAEGEAAAGNR